MDKKVINKLWTSDKVSKKTLFFQKQDVQKNLKRQE